MDFFSAVTRSWFSSNFEQPTRVQREGWPALSEGTNALLLAPTGSGKTLAAFLWALDRLARLAPDTKPGVRTLYVSPLKALVYDVERNLRAPLVGIRRHADRIGQSVRQVRVDIRTGDTPARDRRRQLKEPADILVTTPESLFLLLGSQAAATLRSVETVIVDEIHAFAPSKRGVHLALSLERLETLTEKPPQRIGLSATVRPHDEAARFLAGSHDVTVIDASEPAHVDLSVVTVDQAQSPPSRPKGGPILSEGTRQPATAKATAGPPKRWDLDDKREGGQSAVSRQPVELGASRLGQRKNRSSNYELLLEQIKKHRSTIVFVNSRSQAERMAQGINELADASLVQSHHGSLSHERRAEIEEALKAGTLKGIVATSSLELGIDMGAIDLVILVESPGSVVRGLQRVGRAGHQVGERSRGIIIPKFRGDMVECAVVARRMEDGLLEPIHVPQNALDVLAQQIVALCTAGDWKVNDILELVRRAYPYRELTRDVLVSVLDMLAGRYPSDAFADLSPRLNWDRGRDIVSARRGSKMLSLLNAGTIPDRGLYGVHLGKGGPRVGELDEEMVFETKPGEVFLLGASSWRVEEITRDQVIVTPAPGEPGKMPFWRGDGPGRPIELGRAIGAFVDRVGGMEPDNGAAWVEKETPLGAGAARDLVAYIQDQKEHTGCLPTDKNITIERFRDELGDWRICILTPFGSRVHAPWSLALEEALGTNAGFAVQTLYSDDGIILRFADVEEELPGLEQLIPDPDEVEDRVIEQLSNSALFAGAFRENAARSLLMPRRRPDRRMPLWQQRLKAKALLADVRKYPSFPVILETYRQCLKDIFDLPTLVEVLGAIRRREIRVDDVETASASPFSRSLVYAYVAMYLYEQDAPLAERKAQALTLDRGLLRELLGQAELRELIDPAVVDEVEAELQCLADSRKARHADALHDILRRVGDLTEAEIDARTEGDSTSWLEGLERQRRAVRIRIAGGERWIAAEDTSRYRDALGILPPSGLPDSLLEPVAEPFEDLLRRYARTHGPFATRDPAERFGLHPSQVEPALRNLESSGRLVRGEIRPGGAELDWCDADALRRLKRRTLAKLRHEVAPVEAAVLGRFLPSWHGLGGKRGGPERLGEVVAQLEGLALPWSSLSRVIFPERVNGFRIEMLDMLSASGAVVWIGAGPLGMNDGKVILFRRERIKELLEPPPPYEPASSLHEALLEHLQTRGASFSMELGRLSPKTKPQELQEALWDLVWAGQITNDTFLPLRTLGKRSRRSRRPVLTKNVEGRWSMVRDLLDDGVTLTERAYARAQMLLERYGIVSREAAGADDLPGGFKSIYGVLKAMEEAGRLRRGYFVEGLSATQFAYPGAVERLRASRSDKKEDEVFTLAAVDPANPWGSLLPWPETSSSNGQRARRVPGAWIIFWGGSPALYIHLGGRALLTFEPMQIESAASALISELVAMTRHTRSSLRLARIDGEPAAQSSFGPQMLAAGFFSDYNDLVFPYQP